MDYRALETSLIDLVKEQQAKLGYRREEVSLYYPLSTLNHFFGGGRTAEEMHQILKGFAASAGEKYGEITVARQGDRFCFHLSEEMSEYVHSTMKENEFIRELVELTALHGTTMEQIRELFSAYSRRVEETRIKDGEFDWMLRFVENEEDRYCYCFKDEGGHMIYHRFLPEDYEEFGY